MASVEQTTTNTPLAPSVEKAYYRKCIELKKRLKEVEAANDKMLERRHRLDRAIMKMRLERAFLLDQLRKRMNRTAEGSDESEEEVKPPFQPPVDRPHRDKRRRQSHHPDHPDLSTAPSTRRREPSAHTRATRGNGNNGDHASHALDHHDAHPADMAAHEQAFQNHSSPYPSAPVGVPGAAALHMNASSLDAMADMRGAEYSSRQSRDAWGHDHWDDFERG